MPMVKRRPLTKAVDLVSPVMRHYLKTGIDVRFMFEPGGKPPVETIKRAWGAVKRVLVAEVAAEDPGCRPWGFWKFERHRRRDDEVQPEAVARLGLCVDGDEAAAVESLLDDPASYYLGRCRGKRDAETVGELASEVERHPLGGLSDDGLRDFYWRCRTAKCNAMVLDGRRYCALQQSLAAKEIMSRGISWSTSEHWVDAEVEGAVVMARELGVPIE